MNEGIEWPFRSGFEVEKFLEGEDLAVDDEWGVFGWKEGRRDRIVSLINKERREEREERK